MLPERIASESMQCNLVIEAVDSTYPSERIDIPTSTTNIYWGNHYQVSCIRNVRTRKDRRKIGLEYALRCISVKKTQSQIQVGKEYWPYTECPVALFCKYFRVLFLRSLEAGNTV
jgi:hypothetical protein